MPVQNPTIPVEPSSRVTLAGRQLSGWFELKVGAPLRWLNTVRAEFAAIERLRERGIDAVAGGMGSRRAEGLPIDPHKQGPRT